MTLEADQVVQILLRQRLRIAAIAAAIVRDVHAADDIFQQVVLAALEDRSQFRELDHLLAWAIRAARHRAIDLVRARKLVPLPDEVLDMLEAQWGDPSPEHWSDRVEALHRCVGKLAGTAREMIQMKYVEGMCATVIAEKLRRSPAAVYQSLSRIHRSLRDCALRELVRLENPVQEGVP